MLLNKTKTYNYKINLLLNDISIYEKINEHKIITKTQKFNQSDQGNYLEMKTNHCMRITLGPRIPKLYGLSKTHKVSIPMYPTHYITYWQRSTQTRESHNKNFNLFSWDNQPITCQEFMEPGRKTKRNKHDLWLVQILNLFISTFL